VSKTGIYIISTAPITAYYEEGSFFNAEIFVLKGRNAIGKRFFIAGQNFYDNSEEYIPGAYFSFDIVATEDNTVVRVHPTKPLEGFEEDSIITIRLNKGETFSLKKPGLMAKNNPMGTLVESSKPIAITVKDDSLINGGCRDLVGDQLIPAEVAGTEYIVVTGFLNKPEFFFITATEDNTEIYMEALTIPVATLDAGESRRFDMRFAAVYVRSNKRIYVAHVTGFGCEMGMAILPPVTCTGSRQVGFTRSSPEFFGLNILVKKEGIHYFTLNGSQSLIPPHLFQPVIGTNDEWYTAQLSFTTVQVPVDLSSLLVNSKHSFQAGIINGNASTSARFGFFSSFSTLFIGDDFKFCDGTTVSIDAGPGKESYLWNTGATTQSIQIDKTGEYWVRVSYEDCILSDTIRVDEVIGSIELGPDVSICEGETTKIDGKENFSWSWSDGSTGQFLETSLLGKYWVSVVDEIGCEASDTINVARFVHEFDPDVEINMNSVSVDTADEKNIHIRWSVSDKERDESNQVSVYKRSPSDSWELLEKVNAGVSTYTDINSNTDDEIFEFYVGLANRCGLEQRTSKIHNTIRLSGEGDEVANTIRLGWNYYVNWDEGVQRYELWRKKEDEAKYTLLTELYPDADNFVAPIATDAFHHNYVIRAIESSGESESWSNSVQFDFEHPVYIPNVFTPNSDSFNQFFEIKNIQLYANSRLIIVDRWGMPVLERNGYVNDWDGDDLAGGVYFYILSLNRNNIKPMKGTLSIIK
jgi:gliding motility-associated-like protein